MTSYDFNSLLFSRFPELKAVSDERFSYFDGEPVGHTIIFEDILNEAIVSATSHDPSRLSALMQFVEEVAQQERNLVAVCLAEHTFPPQIAQGIYDAAGVVTKRIFAAERHWPCRP